jgi:hypothetical protein
MRRYVVSVGLLACSSPSSAPPPGAPPSNAALPSASVPAAPLTGAQPLGDAPVLTDSPPEPMVPAVLSSSGRGAIMVRVPASAGQPALWVDRTEVSELELRLSAGEREGQWLSQVPQAPRAAALVTYADAKAHCAWARKRLPTADEWARAAGPGLRGTAAALPGLVDAGAPNGVGLYGMDNEAIEWTSTRGTERDTQRVGGLDASMGNELYRDETKLAFRCALDERGAKPLPPVEPPVSLISGNAVCARRAADRATYCMSQPKGYFAELAPGPESGWTRESNLDAALQIAWGCALWPDRIACTTDDMMYVRDSDGAERFEAWGSGVWVEVEGHFRMVINPTTRWYDGPKPGVKRFPVQFGVVELHADGTARHALPGANEGEQKKHPLALPGGVSAVFDLGETTCLRVGDGLSCGKLEEGRYVEAARLAVPLKAAEVALGAFCLLLDDGTARCGRTEDIGNVPLSALRTLPPPTLGSVRQLASGYGNICASTQNGHVHCLSRDVQREMIAAGKPKGDVRLEPAPLPRP